MPANIDRAILLLNQSRYDLAEKELRGSLADDPSDPAAHAFLALCLMGRSEWDEAGREAGAAVRLAPGMAFAHSVAARIFLHQSRREEAESAAREAIRLSPGDAEFYALLATIHHDRRRWPDVLEVADQGLAIDPGDADCANLRAMALVNLGRKKEAEEAIRGALARDPRNAFSHANQGWTLLHQGEHAKALEHFREALRIDPELEWARAGIVEALKSRHLIYRLMLRYFLWMSTLSGKAQWAVLLGILFGRRILAGIARSNPTLAPWIWPLIVALLVFVYLTWIADPLFNLMLRLNRFGRLALSRDQRVASNWVGLCVLGATLSAVALAATRDLFWYGHVLIYFAVLIVPISATFQTPRDWRRLLLGTYTTLLALMGMVFFLGFALIVTVTLRLEHLKLILAPLASIPYLFLMGAMLSTWINPLLKRGR